MAFPVHKPDVVIDVDVNIFLQQKELEVETVRFVDFDITLQWESKTHPLWVVFSFGALKVER